MINNCPQTSSYLAMTPSKISNGAQQKIVDERGDRNMENSVTKTLWINPWSKILYMWMCSYNFSSVHQERGETLVINRNIYDDLNDFVKYFQEVTSAH